MVPRLVIAAPASGSGKTTLATGLIAAFARRGTAVAPFKVGPDYVDPGYHTLAAGRPGRNLDPVLVGEARVPALFGHGRAGAEVAVIEGVMGLFDGRIGAAADSAAHAGSTAHVARLLDAPVLLVVDARGQGQSLAALLHGFARLRPVGAAGRRWCSTRSAVRGTRRCCVRPVPRSACRCWACCLGTPSWRCRRGTSGWSPPPSTARRRATRWTPWPSWSPHTSTWTASGGSPGPHPPCRRPPPWDPAAEVGPPVTRRPVIAIAGGAAFTFGYAEHVELLAAAGAEVAVVDPLRDERLPAGTAGLVLPGGFPEEHAELLSANAPLRAAVAELAASGAPVHAECGGLLYLGRGLDGHPMCGVLPADGSMTGRLRLGYRDATAATGSPPFRAGQHVTGHEFHHCAVTPAAGRTSCLAVRRAGAGRVRGRRCARVVPAHPPGGGAGERAPIRGAREHGAATSMIDGAKLRPYCTRVPFVRKTGAVRPGMVSFVGAGPGAADLITLRGAQRIAAADVVIWAASLVAEECVTEHARPDAELLDSSRLTHEDVLAVYRRAAAEGLRVARVHSGDPALWGAVQEQYDACVELGLEVEIVPGVSAFTAAAAAAGRELTIPEVAQSVVLTRLEGGKTPMPQRERLREFARHGTTMAVFLSAARTAAAGRRSCAPAATRTTPRSSWPTGSAGRTSWSSAAGSTSSPRWSASASCGGTRCSWSARRWPRPAPAAHLYHAGHFHTFRKPDPAARAQLRGRRAAGR